MREALFAYGSLVDPASAALTLGRELDPAALTRATAPGHRRRFSAARDNLACEKTFALADGSLPPTVLGINLELAEADAGEAPNGILIPVGPADLARLDRRELRYRRAPLHVAGAGGARFERVWAFCARPECFAPEAPAGAVILRAYAAAIESAFSRLGTGELERYRRTTLPYPAPVVEAELVRDRIPAGNPRAW